MKRLCWQKRPACRRRQCPPGPRFRQGHRPARQNRVRSMPRSWPTSARWSRPTVRPLESKDILEFRDDRRGQLVRMLAVETIAMPLRVAPLGKARNIERHIGYLQARIAELEDRMGRHCPSIGCLPCQRRHSAIRRRHRTAGLADPVGPPARTGPENPPRHHGFARLGSLRRRQRHQKRPARHIPWRPKQSPHGPVPGCRRGHSPLPTHESLYASLKARGKASKLALIAVARKILVLANALIRTMTPYQAPANSVC